jgi:hypothetical protein
VNVIRHDDMPVHDDSSHPVRQLSELTVDDAAERGQLNVLVVDAPKGAPPLVRAHRDEVKTFSAVVEVPEP